MAPRVTSMLVATQVKSDRSFLRDNIVDLDDPMLVSTLLSMQKGSSYRRWGMSALQCFLCRIIFRASNFVSHFAY